MDKPRVDVESIVAARLVLARFDRLDLSQVALYEHGKPIEIPVGTLDTFRFTGLSNQHFVTMRLWEGTLEQP